MSWTIGTLAAAGEVGVETVRFYQRKGLLDSPSRDQGVRRYGQADLRRLRFIRKAQAAGFSLEEIGELIALDAAADRHRAHALARQRMQRLDAQIEQLRRARDSLKRLADACAQGPARCACPILSAFEDQAG
jgi:MerR family transcriptional regulator, mercuric resistance operon regulatory protein